jgi:hypothetical protein
MMPGWIPRWHPIWWAVVIILAIAIFRDPTGMGARAGSIIHGIEHAAGQAVVFVESI